MRCIQIALHLQNTKIQIAPKQLQGLLLSRKFSQQLPTVLDHMSVLHEFRREPHMALSWPPCNYILSKIQWREDQIYHCHHCQCPHEKLFAYPQGFPWVLLLLLFNTEKRSRPSYLNHLGSLCHT